MKRHFTGLVIALALAGCGPSVDPRLCETCQELARIADDPGKSAQRENLRERRDRTISALQEIKRMEGSSMPPHFDCPECDKAYERLLRV
jgi:hypothetical protein